MKAITYTTARKGLAATMDEVCREHAPVIITRKRNRAVVMLPLEDYESLEETAYLLRSPANIGRLFRAIGSLARGKGRERRLNLTAGG
jgi:antitoxin YefM